MFLESCPFLLGCQIFLYIIVYSILLFLWLSVRFGFFLFSSWWTWPGGCQFVYPFKKTVLGFVDFFPLILNLYCIYFPPDIYDFLPSAKFKFCLFSFSILFGSRLGFTWYFFLFCLFLFYEDLYQYELPSKIAFAASHRIFVGCVFIVICLKVFLITFLILY